MVCLLIGSLLVIGVISFNNLLYKRMSYNVLVCQLADSNIFNLGKNFNSFYKTAAFAISRPDFVFEARSFCVRSPVMIAFEPKPILVRNIFICDGVVF